ncbi:uncharacterized protein BO96DRAFT_164007 [Aspergillus niger CBS 101883]|uniref:Contig An01c0070, genomic contig n=3 Tax=Aspergillus niger TaxID=5061 RepID=A2Q7P0_ASPNC|nr:uncharacterized protein BO96DRAFT_164007 [Aspergillus niger CBS 101883]XP_059603063.1 uncharacterized protein An01g01410 [Aspergillus niger]PYH52321.1 hypothetical protein BO96DRAFT_164007 [Aspergillus niger CBS 101883]RDH19809.1 hypothetical protein M747DRAFT_49110 [Aspergillus niger ATCC 13496]CAK43513.1 unnamed protein product [Aspergillus niger]
MKFIPALGALALAASANAAVTGNCTPGLDYCSSVLGDVGGNDAAIVDALNRAGQGGNAPWSGYLFHCNADKSLTASVCVFGCANQGAGQSDMCFGL